METKSLITSPSGEVTLPRAGIYKITGLAWSGSGSIRGVEGLDGQFSEGVSYPFIFRMIRADRLVDLGIIFAYFSTKHKKPVARRTLRIKSEEQIIARCVETQYEDCPTK